MLDWVGHSRSTAMPGVPPTDTCSHRQAALLLWRVDSPAFREKPGDVSGCQRGAGSRVLRTVPCLQDPQIRSSIWNITGGGAVLDLLAEAVEIQTGESSTRVQDVCEDGQNADPC